MPLFKVQVQCIFLGGLPANVYRPEDGAHYNLLLSECRAALDALGGERKLLTIASPAGPKLVAHLDVPGMAKIVDFINVRSRFNRSLRSCS